MAVDDLKKLKPGIYYREHPSRKRDSIHKDRQWVIFQKLGGIRRQSVIGWEKLEKITEGQIIDKAAEWKANHKWNLLHPDQPAKPKCLTDERDLAEKKMEDNPTFNDLADRFLTHYVEPKLAPKTAYEYQRHLKKVFVPIWGKIRVSELDRKQIIKLIETLGQEAPIQANRKLATLKKCLAYAVDVGLLDENPAASVKKPGIENTKDRVLETKELTTLIRFLNDYSDKTAADILRLIALTAARPGEVCSMKLEHLIEKENGVWWSMPKTNTKNKQPHQIFLNKLAASIVYDRIEKDLVRDGYLFPATKKNGETSHTRTDVLTGKVKRVLRSMNEAVLPINDFSAHDLRRSCATGIAAIGFGGVVPDILNHSPQGVTRKIYDKYNRHAEIKRALTAWGDYLNRAVSGNNDNVVEISLAIKNSAK